MEQATTLYVGVQVCAHTNEPDSNDCTGIGPPASSPAVLVVCSSSPAYIATSCRGLSNPTTSIRGICIFSTTPITSIISYADARAAV